MRATSGPKATPTEHRWAAVGGVLLATLYLWVLAWLVAFVALPAVGLGWTPVVITSGSMEPLVRPGDVVLVDDVPAGTLAPGAVITFEDAARPGTLTTHRVTGSTVEGAYRTRGDANVVPDSDPVPADAVVGVARLLVPLVGLPLLWLSSGPLVFAAWLVGTLAALVVAVSRGRRHGAETPVEAAAVDRRHTREPAAVRRRPVAVRRPHRVDRVRSRSVAGRSVLGVVGIALLAGGTPLRSAATFNGVAANTGSSFAASAAFPGADPTTTTLWLQTSPEGQDTVSQPRLPLAAAAPTETTLRDYDTDRDGLPGLKVKRGGKGADETDPTKVQTWVRPVTADLTLSDATVTFHSATKDFDTGKDGVVTWYLRDCGPGGSCIDLGAATVARVDWQSGATGWVEDTASWDALSHTVAAGRELRLTVVVDAASGADHLFAYGTVDQPSRLVLGSPPAGTCPGAGEAIVVAVADTHVEEADPTKSFASENDLVVQAGVGDAARTLLAFELPPVPAGCAYSEATLRLHTVSSDEGRTLEVVRTDQAFDASTVTWVSQPSATGVVATGPSTANGPTALDVTGPVAELYRLGNTGLLVRDAVEADDGTSTNKYDSLEGTDDPDRRPRLVLRWG